MVSTSTIASNAWHILLVQSFLLLCEEGMDANSSDHMGQPEVEHSGCASVGVWNRGSQYFVGQDSQQVNGKAEWILDVVEHY